MIRAALRWGWRPRAAAALMAGTGLVAAFAPGAASAARDTTAGALEADWTATEAPVPLNAATSPDVQILGVSCPSKRSCVAVGSYAHETHRSGIGPVEGLLLKMSGTTWAAKEAPLPTNAASPTGGQDVYLDSVACPSTTTCVATGWYTETDGSEDGLLLTRSGTTWTAAEAPLPAGARVQAQDVQLTSVACPSTSSCVVVGSYVTAKGGTEGVVLSGLGTSWTPTRATPTSSIVNTVACESVSSCAALGADNGGKGLVLTGSGTSWTAGPLPLPAGESTFYPGFVAEQCPSATTCVGAGGYGDAAFDNHGMLVSGSGTSWTATEAPLPADAEVSGQYAVLNGVACPVASSCTAAGSYLDTSNNDQGLLVTGSGTSWTATEAPLPSGASTADPDGHVTAVACPTATSCTAVGDYDSSAATGLGLLLTGSGTSWAATQAPLPAGASTTIPSAYITALACPAATLCIAAGSYDDSSGNAQGLLLSGAG